MKRISADTEALVKQLQAVTVANLPEEVRIYDITDSTENGIRYIEAETDADGIGQALLLLDASGLEQNQLHYFKLYTDLLGELDTTAHTRAQLSSQITRYLYDANVRVSAVDDETECGYTPYLRVSFIAMDEDMDEAYSLIHELLFDTKLDDAQSMLDNVSSIKTSLRKSIVNDCYSVQAIRAFAACSNAYAYYNYVNFLDYYAFLCDLENQLSEDSDIVLANLQAVQNALNNSANAVVGFGGSKESAAVHRSAANNFLSSLGNSEIEAQSYSFPEISRREALVVGGSVQYNLIFASYEDLELEEYSGAMDALTALVSDTYLYPLLRDQYGSYGVLHYASDTGMYIISYRDPNIAEKFDVYASLPELVAELQDIDQETLDGYILSSYSSYALSQGELTGALNAILNTLSGIDQAETLDTMRELKSVTPETIAKYASVYQALADNGMISSSGSAAVIEQNADLYNIVLDPFANEQSAAAALADVAEGDWCYDAIKFMMENDLMVPLSADAFGADSAANMQDLVSAMYSIIGGDGNFDDGLATLSAYGIVPADLNAEDGLTIEELACYGNNYCYALGLNAYEGDDADGAVNFLNECGYLYLTDGIALDTAATRAQVAYLLTAICSAA